MKRISDKLEALVNEQIKHEEESSRLYRAMAECLDFNGWTGAAKLYHKYADEEMTHMKKFYEYLQDRDAHPMTPALVAPTYVFAGLKEVIHASYEHEIQVSKWLDNIALNAMAEKDLALFNFMDWFILEQVEEEKKMKTFIDRITILELTNTPLYFLDKEMGELA